MTATVEGLTPLATGFCFGEGPRWFEGLLWFSDMLGEAVHTVNPGGSLTTLPLPGHVPSGLGFRPDGSLLIVSTENRQLLGYDGETVITIADLSGVAPADLGDMVVDHLGRAYIGSQAFRGRRHLRVDPDNSVQVVAQDLDFPNGMAITPDHSTLIVAESIGRRLTAYSIGDDGELSGRGSSPTVWTGRPTASPRRRRRGVDVDDAGAPVRAHRRRWAVTHRIDIGDRAAIACMLGGPARRTLFMLSSTDAYPKRLIGTRLSRVDAVIVDIRRRPALKGER